MFSNKKNGFQGKATNPESRNIKDGQTVVENKLVADAVSSPKVHARNHSSEHAAIMVENLIAKMKQEMRKNPPIPPDESK